MQLTKTALIAALLFAPVAFAQVQLTSGTGGGVNLGIPGPAGPAGINGVNGAPGVNCAIGSPAGTCDMQGASIANAGQINGIGNVSACHGSNKPSWCGGVDAVQHLQTVINSYIAQLPTNAAGCHVGQISIDPTLGPYTMDGTIFKPRTVGINFNNAMVTYTPTSGWAIVGADACKTTSPSTYIDQTPEGVVQNAFFYQGTSNTTGYTTNTAGFFYAGGDPLGVISPSTSYGFSQIISNVQVTGFFTAYSQGNNAFENLIVYSRISRNYRGIYDPAGAFTTNSGEANSLIGDSFFGQQYCDIEEDVGQEWISINSKYDYAHGQATGGGHWCGTAQSIDSEGDHVEDTVGPFISHAGTSGRDSIRVHGSQLWLIGAAPQLRQALTTYEINNTVTDLSSHTQKAGGTCTTGSSTPTWNDSGSTTSDGTCTWTDQGANTYPTESALFALGGNSSQYELTGFTYIISHPYISLADTTSTTGSVTVGTGAFRNVGNLNAGFYNLTSGGLSPTDTIYSGTFFDLSKSGSSFHFNNVPSNGIRILPSATSNTAVLEELDASSNVWFAMDGQGRQTGFNFAASTGSSSATTFIPFAADLTSATTDQKRWDMFQDASTWNLRICNDAYSSCNNAITVVRSGNSISSVKINGVASYRGTATLVSGTVTVSNAAACVVGSTCVYNLAHCGLNSSTAIGTLSTGTISAGTSFVINALSATNTVATGDLSTVCWQIN